MIIKRVTFRYEARIWPVGFDLCGPKVALSKLKNLRIWPSIFSERPTFNSKKGYERPTKGSVLALKLPTQ